MTIFSMQKMAEPKKTDEHQPEDRVLSHGLSPTWTGTNKLPRLQLSMCVHNQSYTVTMLWLRYSSPTLTQRSDTTTKPHGANEHKQVGYR